MYSSKEIFNTNEIRKLNNSATDHLPVVCRRKQDSKQQRYEKKITKRSLKNFTEEKWRERLADIDWSDEDAEEDLDSMVKNFSSKIEEALDDVAPYKSFTVKSKFKYGLSESSESLMGKRDKGRKEIKNASESLFLGVLNRTCFIFCK